MNSILLGPGVQMIQKQRRVKGTKVSALLLLLPTMSAMKCCEPPLYPSALQRNNHKIKTVNIKWPK